MQTPHDSRRDAALYRRFFQPSGAARVASRAVARNKYASNEHARTDGENSDVLLTVQGVQQKQHATGS
jgi:hypothetical protein